MVEPLEGRRCVFCGEALSGKKKPDSDASRRAREHIIPLWLQKHLGIDGDEIVQVHISHEGKEDKRQHALMNLLQGRCCKGCNEGWMSRLEVAASPILQKLMVRSRTLNDLSPAEKETLGAWTLKTAYALLSTGQHWDKVPRAHVEHLIRHQTTPQGVRVFGTHVDTGTVYTVRSFWKWNLMGSPTESERRLFETQTYKVTFHFGDLVLLAAYMPAPGWWIGAIVGRHYPVSGTWPAIKWLQPQELRAEVTTVLEGLKAFSQDLYAIQENLPVKSIVAFRGQSIKFRVSAEPTSWVFPKRPGE